MKLPLVPFPKIKQDGKNSSLDNQPEYLNQVFFKNSRQIYELFDNSVHLVVTSSSYFNIKDYSLAGYQKQKKKNGKTQTILHLTPKPIGYD